MRAGAAPAFRCPMDTGSRGLASSRSSSGSVWMHDSACGPSVQTSWPIAVRRRRSHTGTPSTVPKCRTQATRPGARRAAPIPASAGHDPGAGSSHGRCPTAPTDAHRTAVDTESSKSRRAQRQSRPMPGHSPCETRVRARGFETIPCGASPNGGLDLHAGGACQACRHHAIPSIAHRRTRRQVGGLPRQGNVSLREANWPLRGRCRCSRGGRWRVAAGCGLERPY